MRRLLITNLQNGEILAMIHEVEPLNSEELKDSQQKDCKIMTL